MSITRKTVIAFLFTVACTNIASAGSDFVEFRYSPRQILGQKSFQYWANRLSSMSQSYQQKSNRYEEARHLFNQTRNSEYQKLMSKIIDEKQSSGDLFTLPIILGIIIGRMGCFLAGINEFTYGIQTTSLLGMDLGDRLQRHPIALYEILFLVLLFMLIKQLQKQPGRFENGTYFKIFMICYFTFRFVIEFLKPNAFLLFRLSSIQYLCLICLLYYYKTFRKGIIYAY